MSSKVSTAIAAAAPEIGVPVQALRSLLGSQKSTLAGPQLSGDILLIPPPEKSHLIRFGKDKIRVRTRKGIRIVTVERARGLTAAETIGVAVVLAVGYELMASGVWAGFNPVTADKFGTAVGTRFGKTPKNAQQATLLGQIFGAIPGL